MNTQTSTKENLNRIIDFRQGIYEAGFTKASDAQFELLDALLLTLQHFDVNGQAHIKQSRKAVKIPNGSKRDYMHR